jgi:hypothetical protein
VAETEKSTLAPFPATPAPIRAVRLTRAALHLVEGLATTAFVFPFAKHAARRRLI